MKRSSRIAIFFYVLIVLAYVIMSINKFGIELIHPNMRNQPAEWTYELHSFASSHFESSGLPILFRGNSQRHGVAQFPVSKSGVLEEVIPELNVGVHTAAKSSPMSNGETLFVGTDSGWFYAIDEKTEKILWRVFAPSALRGFHSNAVIQGNHVWIGDYYGRLYCFETRTGILVWMRQLGKTIGASPLLVGDDLYINVEVMPENGFMVKLKSQTGEKLWQSAPWGQQSHSSPSLSSDQKSIFVGSNNSKLFSVSTETGRIQWQAPLDAKMKGSPLVWNDKIYLVTQAGSIKVFMAQTGELVSSEVGNAESLSSPTLDAKQGIIYFTDVNKILRLDTKKFIYRSLNLGNKLSYSSPIFVGPPSNQLLAVCEDTKLCEVSLDLKSRRILFDTKHRISSTPYLAKSEVWLSTDNGPLMVFKEHKK